MEATVYYHQDGLGSTVALTDENGNILNKYAYDPFGEPHILQEAVENSMLFTGEPFDQSGLIYLRARYYDPKTGRFVSSDKYKGEIADPSSQNSYAYCGNNPVNAVDPSGFDSYIFYDPNINGKGTGEASLKGDKEALEKKYGTPCHLIPTTNYEKFKEEWNKMGTVDENEVSIDGVVLFTHGNQKAIMLSVKNYLTEEGIRELNKKTIDTLILLGCKNGNVEINNNPAKIFFETQNVNNVVAADGKVLHGKVPISETHFFISLINSSGFLQFQRGRVEPVKIGRNLFTMESLLKKVDSIPKVVSDLYYIC